MAKTTKKLRVLGDALRVRETPSFDGKIVSKLYKDDIVDYNQTSENNEWINISKGSIAGWSYYKYLSEIQNTESNKLFEEIFDAVSKSSITNYFWKDRGRANIGFYKGMALVFARVYCKLTAGDPSAKEMAKANTGNMGKDALAYYSDKMNEAGLINETEGVDTLRHLFVLMIGLAMRESSGRYCVGRDMSAQNTKSETAEAGLFQTSYNAITASPRLQLLFDNYKSKPDGFVEIFKEGYNNCSAADWDNYGTGEGKRFQQLSKECPAFSAEFAGVALRSIRKHWGPINNKHVEVRPECNLMLLKVQHIIDINKILEI